MLFRILDEILGSRTKVRLLRALFPLDEPVTGREARRLARVRSVSAAGQALDELALLGVLHRVEAGGAHLYRVNRDHLFAEPLRGLLGVESRLPETLRSVLSESLERAGVLDQLTSAVVFGSYARGEAAAGSDLDLLAISMSVDFEEPIRNALLAANDELRRLLGSRLSPYVMSLDRLRERSAGGDPLVEAAEREGRTVLGVALDELLDRGDAR
jgi:predicted nucleotidyltransferase